MLYPKVERTQEAVTMSTVEVFHRTALPVIQTLTLLATFLLIIICYSLIKDARGYVSSTEGTTPLIVGNVLIIMSQVGLWTMPNLVSNVIRYWYSKKRTIEHIQ